ncbi:hypothetical protein [Sphingomonas oryzagri]
MPIDIASLGVVEHISDLRSGVLRSGHQVFDALEMMRAAHLGPRRDWGPAAHLETARALAEKAARTVLLTSSRALAIEAAAHAIFAIELLDGEGRP